MNTLTIPEPGTYVNLQGHQQMALKSWLGHCLDEESRKVGLWVYGDRCGGSTYVASVAVRRMVREVADDWDYVTATQLMDRIRDSWSSGEVARGNSNDYELYVESAAFEDAVNKLWTTHLLWIDDLYDEHDLFFWRRHVWLRVQERVKGGLPTVIATNMNPAAPQMEGLTKVIETWFVTCYAER